MFSFLGLFLGRWVGLGSLWGWGIGSLLDAVFSPQRGGEGPRVTDRDVSSDPYGQAAPRVWGVYRLATRVIQADKLKEHRHKEREGGFLFFGGTEWTYYTYSCTWAVHVCEGPVSTIRRIWAGPKLIFDLSDEASSEEKNNSLKLLDNPQWGISIYLGDEIQLPDPVLAKLLGDNKAWQPAYRGQCVIVFREFPLQDHGNWIPPVTVEVIRRAERGYDGWLDISGEMTALPWARLQHKCAVAFGRLWVTGGFRYQYGGWLTGRDCYSGIMRFDGSMDWKSEASYPRMMQAHGLVFFPSQGPGIPDRLISLGGFNETQKTYYADPHDGDMALELRGTGSGWESMPMIGESGWPTYERVPLPRDSFACAYYQAPYPYGAGVWLYGGRNSQGPGATTPPLHGYEGDGSAFRDLWFFNGRTWFLETPTFQDEWGKWHSVDGGAGYRVNPSMCVFRDELYLFGGHLVTGDATGEARRDLFKLRINPVPPIFVPVSTDVMHGVEWPNKSEIYGAGLTVHRDKLIAMLSMDSIGGISFIFFESSDGVHWDYMAKAGPFSIVDTDIFKYYVEGDLRNEVVVDDELTVVNAGVLQYETVTGVSYDAETDRTEIRVGTAGVVQAGKIYVNRLQGLVTTGDSLFQPASIGFLNYKEHLFHLGGSTEDHLIKAYKSGYVSEPADTITLAEIVQDISRECGLAESDIEAGTLTDEVHGFARLERTSGRNLIEDLQRYGYFSVRESNGRVEFVKNDSPPALTIPEVDLAQHEINTEIPQALALTQNHALDLPRQVDVIYPDQDRDHNSGTQTALRQTGASDKKVSVNTAVVMGHNKAKHIAETLLRLAYLERNTIPLQLGPRYFALDPGDLVTVPAGGVEYALRITKVELGHPGLVKCESVLHDAAIYGQQFAGVEPPPPTRHTVLATMPVKPILLDIPYLFSLADDDYGFYLGVTPANGDASKWRGAEVYLWDSGGVNTMQLKGWINGVVTYGTAETWLPPVKYGRWDNITSLQVRMVYGAPADATEEEMLAGANLAVLGDEILQFRDVEDLGSGVFKLSGFVRGRYASEPAMFTHTVGERFVLLEPEKFLRVRLGRADLGRTYHYKIIQGPQDFGDVDAIEFTSQALSRRCKPPVHWTVEKQANGDWQLNWIRRARIDGEWIDGADVPLHEEEEIYRLRLLVDGSPARTIDVRRGTELYLTVRDQVLYYGAQQESIAVEICQVSPEAGEGDITVISG